MRARPGENRVSLESSEGDGGVGISGEVLGITVRFERVSGYVVSPVQNAIGPPFIFEEAIT